MQRFLRDAPIATKIVIAACLPMIGLLVFAGIFVVDAWHGARGARDLRDLAGWAPSLGGLVHVLQKERGISAGFIGAGRDGVFAERLVEQRAATDRLLGPTRGLLAAQVRDGSEALAPRIAAVVDRLDALPELRRQVVDEALPLDETVAAYRETVGQLIALVSLMSSLSHDAQISKDIEAYVDVLEAKERAGLERALGADGFAARSFPPPVHERFVGLIAEQAAYIDRFLSAARPEQRERYRAIAGDPVFGEVERLRRIAVASGYGRSTGGIEAESWFDAMTAKIDRFKELEDMAAAALVGGLDDKVRSASRSLAVSAAMVLALLVLTSAVVVVIVRSITRPCRRMTLVMSELAGGEHDVEVLGAERGDEIGEMARAVEVFRCNAIEARRLATERAAEQAAKAERTGRIEQLCQGFSADASEIIESVASAATQLRQTAGTMSATAEETNGQARVVAGAASESSEHVSSVAAAMEQLSGSIDEIGRQVAESSATAGTAMEEAARAGDTMEELADAGRKIGEVIELITAIAGQTNLLALNATIEAARAGDAGKGFAVVASEVKSLADQTSSATADIGRQISAMQQATQSAVAAMEDIRRVIGRLAETAGAIASAVEEQTAATQEMSRSIQGLAEGTHEIAASVAGVREASGETGVAAEQVLGAADQLSVQAESLRGEVRSFLTGLSAA